MRYQEILENDDSIKSNAYPIKTRYDYYNRLLFKGGLPNIKLMFGTLNNKVEGLATVQFDQNTNQIVQGSLGITLSPRFLRTVEQFDSLLIHEMIHIFFYVSGNFKEDHGAEFQRMAKQFSNRLGFQITLTDDVSHLAPTNMAVKPYVVIVCMKDGKRNWALLSPAVLNDASYLDSTVRSFASNTKCDAIAYQITSPLWSLFANRFHAHDAFDSTYKENEEMKPLLDELPNKGKVIIDTRI